MGFKHERFASDRSLGRKRRMLGLTQHALSREANVLLSRLIYAETGRITLEQDELDRIRHVFRQRAKKAMELVSA
jgi:hypothetical protein